MGAVRRVGHRQDGERAGGQEPLVGDAVMGFVMADGADDPVLGIAPLRGGDPGLAAQQGLGPVRRDNQRRCQNGAVGERQFGDRVSRLQALGPGRRHDLHIRRSFEQGGKALPDRTVFDDPAEGGAVQRAAELPVVVVQEQRRGAVGDADIQDRLGGVLDFPPQADLRQEPLRRIGDRRGPAVIGRGGERRQRRPVDQGDGEPAGRQRQRQRAADHAPADDDDVGRVRPSVGAARRHGARGGASAAAGPQPNRPRRRLRLFSAIIIFAY